VQQFQNAMVIVQNKRDTLGVSGKIFLQARFGDLWEACQLIFRQILINTLKKVRDKPIIWKVGITSLGSPMLVLSGRLCPSQN